MRTIAFVDTYYPDVLKANPFDGVNRTTQLAKLCFGTSNFYSEAFKKMGWDAYDIVGNDWQFHDAVLDCNTIINTPVDVVYCQDLCYFSEGQIQAMKHAGKAVVGQISSKWPGDDIIKNYDVLFTSFPHFIPKFTALGVRGEFLPIAFGEQVLNYVTPVDRDINISFVGGLGGADAGGYWTQGTALFESVARNFPTFRFYGYFIGNIANYPNLNRAYCGPAWGLDQYKVYARSKIVLNRHGEVAEGFTNNMRCFEATGMGACLFTEQSKNLDFYFEPGLECVSYGNTEEVIHMLGNYNYDISIGPIAARGQKRTLKDHTYTSRLATIEPILRGLIK